KVGSLPGITSKEITNLFDVEATLGGTVTSDGGSKIVALGVCWSSTGEDPTVNDNFSAVGTYTYNGIEETEWDFSATITQLTPKTSYKARVYVANEAGVSYGETKSFTTKAGKTFHTLTPAMIDTYTQEIYEGPKEALVDGDLNTFWHSAWSDEGTAIVQPLPHHIQITFAKEEGIGGIQWWTRGTSLRSGDPNYFDLQTSSDGVTWATVWTSEDELTVVPRPDANEILLPQNYYSKYFRIRILGVRATPETTFTHMAELKVYHDGLLD
ncbi:MAG: discoidin domain-containing protein, partial [Bacteroidales bacterium]|nr:discoidin domain-containing protein [Bacteroidales bacterium]